MDLLKTLDPITVRALAVRDDTPSAILSLLYHSADDKIRALVAAHKNTDQSILAALSFDESSTVRNMAARNVSTPSEILAKLSLDAFYDGFCPKQDKDLLKSLALNPSTPSGVLKELVRFMHRVKPWTTQDEEEQIGLLAAQNPAVSIDPLIESMENDSMWATQVLAINPNTPIEVLERIAMRLPGRERWKEAQRRWLSDDDKDESALYWRSLNIICALAINPAITESLLTLIVERYGEKDGCRTGLSFVLNHWFGSDEAVFDLGRTLSSSSALRAILVDEFADTKQHVSFGSLWESDRFYRYMFSCPELPSDFLAAEAHNLRRSIIKVFNPTSFGGGGSCFPAVINVAANPATPVEALEMLLEPVKEAHAAMYDYGWLYEPLPASSASMPCPQSWWNANFGHYRLDLYKGILENVAANPSAPMLFLESIASSTWRGLRASAAKNPNATFEMLAAFAEDHDDETRFYAYINPRYDLLTSLGDCADNSVCFEALFRGLYVDDFDVEDSYMDDSEKWFHWFYSCRMPCDLFNAPRLNCFDDINDQIHEIIRSSEASKELLWELSLCKRPMVRGILARSGCASAFALGVLAKDAEPWVRAGVAGNPIAPIDCLTLLSADDNVRVRIAVANNPNAPVTILEAMAFDECEVVRIEVAKSHTCSSGVLRSLGDDESWLVRVAARQNFAFPRIETADN